MTDRKSVASVKDGLRDKYKSFTSMGPFRSSVSTFGTSARVLVLYEYSLFGNCIEHLTALHEIGDYDLAIQLVLQCDAVYLSDDLIEYFRP